MSKIQIFSKTLTGKFRSVNQDACTYFQTKEKGMLIAVADGVGKHHHSHLASQIVCQTLQTKLTQDTLTTTDDNEILVWFKKSVLPEIEKKLTTFTEKIATTLTLVLLWQKKFYLLHIGDTRLYQWKREKNTFFKITQDHSVMNNLDDTFSWLKGGKHLKNVVSNYGQCYVDFYVAPLDPGYLFLTTDGLHDFIDLEFAHQVLQNHKLKEETKIEILFNQALNAGSLDDITCVLIKLT